MNCWSITTSEIEGPGSMEEVLQCWVSCDLRRNGVLMLRRVVPVDIVAEVVPAMQMVAQGMAMLEINPRHVIDRFSDRDDTLLEALSSKFGSSPTVEYIAQTVDSILKRGGSVKPSPSVHLVLDQHPNLGEGQQSYQPGLEADSNSTTEHDVRTDPNTAGAEPRGGKICSPD